MCEHVKILIGYDGVRNARGRVDDPNGPRAADSVFVGSAGFKIALNVCSRQCFRSSCNPGTLFS